MKGQPIGCIGTLMKTDSEHKPVKIKQTTTAPVPMRFFNGIAPHALDRITSIRLTDLSIVGTDEEKQWAQATFQRLRDEAREEMIPLTFEK